MNLIPVVRWIPVVMSAATLSAGCSQGSAQKQSAAPASTSASAPAAAPRKAKLGIRPAGDETIKPDLSKVSDELKKVYGYIDEHIDDHVENLQKWVR